MPPVIQWSRLCAGLHDQINCSIHIVNLAISDNQQGSVCFRSLRLESCCELGALFNKLAKISWSGEIDIHDGFLVHLHEMLNPTGLNLGRVATKCKTVADSGFYSSKSGAGSEAKRRNTLI